MWGKKSQSVESKFWSGNSINNYVNQSLYGNFINILTSLFTSNTIDPINNQIKINICEKYKIPTVIVIGAESSGKSSLLEHIIKCPVFPRNTNICTKQPIKLVLKTAQTESEIKYSITYKNIEENIEKNSIIKKIEFIMSELKPEEISYEIITVNICDINLPNFEFIDLPGIRAYPENMAKQTMKLAEDYIKKPNTIVLCVIPAQTPRITSYTPIALIKKYKMESNTIIGLTMCDRVQPVNIYELIVKRITLDTDEFLHSKFAGCIGVINRTHDDSISLETNEIKEQEWFTLNIINEIPNDYSQEKKQLIIDNITGINLIKNVDKLYNNFIKQKWIPTTVLELNKNKNILDAKYKDIGIEISKIDKESLFEYYSVMLSYFHEDKTCGISDDKIVNEYIKDDHIDIETFISFVESILNKLHSNDKFKELYNVYMNDDEELHNIHMSDNNELYYYDGSICGKTMFDRDDEEDNNEEEFDEFDKREKYISSLNKDKQNKNKDKKAYKLYRFEELNKKIFTMIIGNVNQLLKSELKYLLPILVYNYMNNKNTIKSSNVIKKIYMLCWKKASKYIESIKNLDEFINLKESDEIINLRNKITNDINDVSNAIDKIKKLEIMIEC